MWRDEIVIANLTNLNCNQLSCSSALITRSVEILLYAKLFIAQAKRAETLRQKTSSR